MASQSPGWSDAAELIFPWRSLASGNEVDLEIADVVEYLLDDDATSVIALYLEGLRDVARFRQLARRAQEIGKPIVAFVFNGRPLSIRNLAEKASTIFECWYLGQETGTAVAEVLFGDVNPGQPLPTVRPPMPLYGWLVNVLLFAGIVCSIVFFYVAMQTLLNGMSGGATGL